jgi:hypothetical protein
MRRERMIKPINKKRIKRKEKTNTEKLIEEIDMIRKKGVRKKTRKVKRRKPQGIMIEGRRIIEISEGDREADQRVEKDMIDMIDVIDMIVMIGTNKEENNREVLRDMKE